MYRVLVSLALLSAGGLVLYQVSGVAGTSLHAVQMVAALGDVGDAKLQGKDVEVEFQRDGQARKFKFSTESSALDVEIPVYRKDASGWPTHEVDYVVRFRKLSLTDDGELLLEDPILEVHRQPDWSGDGLVDPESPRHVETVIKAGRGRIEKGMQSGWFWNGVEILSQDRETASRIVAPEAWCRFGGDEKVARTEAPVEYRSGGGDLETAPELVVQGVGMDADLKSKKLTLEKNGRVDLRPEGRDFAVRLPGMAEPEKGGEPGKPRHLHMECEEKLVVEQLEPAAERGIERYRVTLNKSPRIVQREGNEVSSIESAQMLRFHLSSRPGAKEEGASKDLEIDSVTATEKVVIVDRKEGDRPEEFEESRAESDYFDWRRLPDGSEETTLKYHPRLTFVGTGGLGDELPVGESKGGSPTRTEVTSIGDMTYSRRAPLGPGGEASETAIFRDEVVVRRVEIGPDGAALPGSDKVLETDRLELDFEPGQRSGPGLVERPREDEPRAKGPRVRTVRAFEAVRYRGAEGEADGDQMVWQRKSPTESVLTLSGESPRLRLLELEDADYVDRGPGAAKPDAKERRPIHLLVTCRDRMVYRRHTPEKPGDVDPDDVFEAVDRVHVEKIPLDEAGKPRADRAGVSTLDAAERIELILAARPPEEKKEKRRDGPGGDLRLSRFTALGDVKVDDPEGRARADRLLFDATDPAVDHLTLSGKARAWSPDGYVHGSEIHYRKVDAKGDDPGEDFVLAKGARGEPAVVWRPADEPSAGRELDPASPPAERHWIQAEDEIRYDRKALKATAQGRAFARVYAAEGEEDQIFSLKGPEAPVQAAPAPGGRTPWVLKAQTIVAEFRPRPAEEGKPARDEDRLEIRRLTGERDVHIYSFKDGRENREARGHRFVHDAVAKKSVLDADPDDPNARVQVWQGEDWVKGRSIEFQDAPGGGVVTSPGGGVVHFKPASQAVDERAPKGPVEIECRGPIVFRRRENSVQFRRDVRVVQGKAEVRCQVLDGFTDPKSRGLTRVEGRQGVLLTMEDKAGRGSYLEWDVARRRGFLRGEPKAEANAGDGRWVWGDVIRFELDGNRVVVENPVGGGQGR